MKKICLVLLLAFSFTIKSNAQLTDQQIAGIYYLEGVTEVGSGFRLLEDHTFEFFFSYGGLDRTGQGTWKAAGNNIVFDSEPWPGADFKIMRQDHKKQKGIVIQVTDKNTMLLAYAGGIVSGDGNKMEFQTDQQGNAIVNLQTADTISLYHQFYSDQLSVFPVKDKKHNYFEFAFMPHLGTVYFKNFILEWKEQELSGGNPLLKEGAAYHYKKIE